MTWGLIILGNQALHSHNFTIKYRHRSIFIVLFIWTFLSLYSGIMGLYGNNDIEYIVGDLYKFLLLPISFVLFYYTIKSLSQIEFIIKWLVYIYAIFLLLNIILNFLNWNVTTFRRAPVPPYTIPILYIIFNGILGNTKPGTTHLERLIVVGIFLSFVFSQSVGFVLNVLLVPFIFMIVKSKNPAKHIFTVAIFSVLIITSIYFLRGFIEDYTYKQYENSRNRIYYKVSRMFESLPILEKIEIIAAGRISELANIVYNEPAKLIIGRGMGSILSLRAIIPEWKQWEGTTSHSMHSVFGETLFRTGILGLSAIVWFLVIFIKKIIPYRTKHPYFVLTLSFSIQYFIGYIIGTPIASAGFPILCLFYVGILIMEKGSGTSRIIRQFV